MAADIILVAAPFFMFWKVKFPKPSDRILILGLFASSVITIIALGLYCAVWYAASHIGPESKLLFKMMGHLHVKFLLLEAYHMTSLNLRLSSRHWHSL